MTVAGRRTVGPPSAPAVSMAGEEEVRSYYGRPILKEPVWAPEVPLYFFTGGTGGASAILATAARLAGNHRLARVAQRVSFAAEAVSAPLLIKDLGRPERFFNMLRVFKVTSPMSVGSWILGAATTAGAAAVALDAAGRAPRLRTAAESASAILGGPLATYTATLIANTAIPAWHEARRELPYLFAASSASSGGAISAALTPLAAAGPARRLAVAGALSQEVIGAVMRSRLGMVGEPYDAGRAGRLRRAASLCHAAGAVLLTGRGRRSRGASLAGAGLMVAAAIATRIAIIAAGHISARDPKYTVVPQRARLAELERGRDPGRWPGAPMVSARAAGTGEQRHEGEESGNP